MPARPHTRHLSSAEDLVTTYEAVRAGFVALALEKNRRATPFVAQARALKVAASQARTPSELLSITEIQAALLTAAGVSDKALAYLQPPDKVEAIQGLSNNFLEPAGANFVEELVFRFLLIRGDTLGGSMRNVGGALAQRKLTRTVISALTIGGKAYHWLHNTSGIWTPRTDDDAGIELSLRGLYWQNPAGPRTLLYNLNVPLVKSNVDLCLLDCRPEELTGKQSAKALYESPQRYLALGELKGGIDPAGADEHWKTARTALNRIRDAFAKVGLKPHTFFIGAAIERRMADEVWQLLADRTLENAANLTHEDQLASISHWLCNL
jgi:hypothetical protein